MFLAISGMRARRDVRPLSEFRANAAAFIEQVQSTRQPIILTQRSRGAAVLLAIEPFEELLSELELLRDLAISHDQAATGRVNSSAPVESRLRALLGR